MVKEKLDTFVDMKQLPIAIIVEERGLSDPLTNKNKVKFVLFVMGVMVDVEGVIPTPKVSLNGRATNWYENIFS
jgi:hypothetical protein